MTPIKNGSAIFNEVPHGFPVLDKTIAYKSETIDLETVPLDGGILVKTLYLSIDPYFRGRMKDPATAPGGFQLGKPIEGYAVVSVVKSEKDGVQPGDILYVISHPFQEYAVLSASHQVRVIKNEPNIPLSAYLGVLGMPGQTSFYGLELVGQPKQGETIYVSSGAGAVGSLVAQLAKAKGLKVIASASSDDKIEFMKSIGVDVAFNYKTDGIADVLAKEGPIDIYWDNVGGATLEAALDACKMHARVVVVGAMSQYNATTPYAVKNLTHILFKRLLVQGFNVIEGEEKCEGKSDNPVKFLEALVPLAQAGKLKWQEQVFEGIESVSKAIVELQTGASTAKVIVKVAEA
ncbi:alcohol dehydrogenase [Ceratobasidium sp. AG-I]|nr:alcohol dehydrogenase [Ceratobasidium sp. AG-I]